MLEVTERKKMATLDEMLKKIVLAGRDEGFMEPGDNVSATGEVCHGQVCAP